MKNIIIYIIVVLSFFFFVDSVSAASYVMPSDFEVPTWARFSNCTSKDVCTSHTNTQLYGSLWYSNANLYTTANGSGIGLNIYTLEGFNVNNYYTVNVLVEVTDDSEMNYGTPLAITSNDKKAGVGLNETQAYQVAGSATVNSMTNVEVRSYRDESTYITYSTGASILSYTFKANTSGNFVFMTMSTGANFTGEWKLYGYQIIDHGSQAPSTSEIQQALQSQFNSVNNTIYEIEQNINNTINSMESSINGNLDEIKDMDISDKDKELPDDADFNDYQDAEDDLMDKVSEADMSVIDIAIDEDSSIFVWDTLTELIQSHTLIFSTVIAILSIGIIKLALGR